MDISAFVFLFFILLTSLYIYILYALHPSAFPPIFNYLIKIVPTTFISPHRSKVHTFQYSVTRYTRRFTPDSRQSPGAYFYYEFTPQRIIVRDRRDSILHFFVRVCAVVGGVAALSKAIDSIAFQISIERNKHGDMFSSSVRPVPKARPGASPFWNNTPLSSTPSGGYTSRNIIAG